MPSGAYEKLVAARETLQALQQQGQGGQAGPPRGGGRVYGALPPRPASPPAAPLVTAPPAAAGGTASRAPAVASAPGPLGAAEPTGTQLTVAQPSTRRRLLDQAGQAEEEAEELLLSFVVDKVAAGAAQFKVNKLHQVRILGIGHWALGIGCWALGIRH